MTIRAMLRDSGFLTERGGRLRLSAKGIGRIGQLALRDIYQDMLRDRPGTHEMPDRGAAQIRPDQTRRHEAADPLDLALGPTLMNAVRREPRTPVGIEPGDFDGWVADLTLDPATREVTRGARKVELTVREYALLEFLMRNIGRVQTRAMLTEHVWGLSFDPESNVVDVYVGYLRRKVDAPGERRLIHTIRGAGYVLRDGS